MISDILFSFIIPTELLCSCRYISGILVKYLTMPHLQALTSADVDGGLFTCVVRGCRVLNLIE